MDGKLNLIIYFILLFNYFSLSFSPTYRVSIVSGIFFLSKKITEQ